MVEEKSSSESAEEAGTRNGAKGIEEAITVVRSGGNVRRNGGTPGRKRNPTSSITGSMITIHSLTTLLLPYAHTIGVAFIFLISKNVVFVPVFEDLEAEIGANGG